MTAVQARALARLQAAADAATPDVRDKVLQALARLRAEVPPDRLERALLSRDAYAIEELASRLPAYLRPALVPLRKVLAAGVREGLRTGPLGVRFDLVSPEAVEAARKHAATLVVQVTAETRRAIRAVVAQSYVQGIPPREAAKLIRELVGLTKRQGQAVLNRYALLLKQGVSKTRALTLARKYADRLLSKRALTIARTETLAAANRGKLAAWRGLQRRGKLSPTAVKVWLVTHDDRLCPRCRPMDGKLAPVGSDFVGPFGFVSAPPLHPNCRCAVSLTFAGARRAA